MAFEQGSIVNLIINAHTDPVSLKGIAIQLTEDDYRGTEEDGRVGIVVNKDVVIASNVSLTVSPVTISEARMLNRLPMNVDLPDDNGGRSPIEASKRIILYTLVCQFYC